MSSLSTLPKGDSAWLLRKSIQRIMQQVSVLETNIGSSTTGNSANTQVIFNDNGTLRGDTGLTFNKTTDLLTVGAATISGDLTVDTSTLKVDSANKKVGIGTASPATILDIQSSGSVFARIQNTASSADAYLLVRNTLGEGFFGINATGPYIYTAGSLPITFTTATSERYRIASDGVATWSNVGGVANTAMRLDSTGLGVGVTPLYKLHAVVTSGAVGAFRASTAAIARLLVGNTVEDVELKVNANGDGQLTANASKYLGLGSGGINDRVILDTSGNLLVGLATAGTTAAKTIQIANGTAPTANVTGGQLYVEAGALKYRGSSGTVTTIANA